MNIEELTAGLTPREAGNLARILRVVCLSLEAKENPQQGRARKPFYNELVRAVKAKGYELETVRRPDGGTIFKVDGQEIGRNIVWKAFRLNGEEYLGRSADYPAMVELVKAMPRKGA